MPYTREQLEAEIVRRKRIAALEGEIARRRSAGASAQAQPRPQPQPQPGQQSFTPNSSEALAELEQGQTVNTLPPSFDPSTLPADETRGAGLTTRAAASLKPNDDSRLNYLRAKYGYSNVHVRNVDGEPAIYMRESPNEPFHPFDPKPGNSFARDIPGDILDLYGGAIPVAASSLGGAAGLAAGPGGVAAGMIGGAYAGEAVRQGLSAMLPGEETATVPERLRSMGEQAQTAVVGDGVGALGAKVIKTVAGATTKKLAELGKARLFKAAVGQNKRAFTQVNGKGLMEKAGEYLDDLGIGFGDSTESIAKKLTTRRDSLRAGLDETVSELDAAAGGNAMVSTKAVADRMEKEVAAPLKRIAAMRGEHAEVMREIKAIRDLDKTVGFAEAAQQRAGIQKQINYDSFSRRDAAAQAKREMARIWNDEIDKKAEGLLLRAGKQGDAYRELRHEYALAEELLGHVNNRVQGNAANRVMSPSDYGVGGIAGVMSGDPFMGAVAAISNHLARVYGNAAAGRAAINIARMATSGAKGAEAVLPSALRAARSIQRPTLSPAPLNALPAGAVAMRDEESR